MKNKKNIISKEHSSLGLTSLSSNIEDIAKKLLGQNGFVEISLLKNWKSIVGEKLSKNCLPERIEYKKGERSNGTLILNVSAGAFALEISHSSSIIIEKINTYFGYLAVQNIKIIQKGDFFVDSDKSNIADIKKKKLVSIDEQNYINAISEGIEDEVLKSRLQSLALSVLCDQEEN